MYTTGFLKLSEGGQKLEAKKKKIIVIVVIHDFGSPNSHPNIQSRQ
jgi:hypothetical protein